MARSAAVAPSLVDTAQSNRRAGPLPRPNDGSMRIAVDLMSLGYDGSGSATYPYEILPRLAASREQFYVLLTKGVGFQLRDHVADKLQIIDLPSGTSNPYYRAFYQRYRLPRWLRREKIDVLFVPGGLTATIRRRGDRFRTVVMLRNMLPFDVHQQGLFPFSRYPYRRVRYLLLSRGLIHSFRSADRIVFISEYSKHVVGPRCNNTSSLVIRHGVGDSFRTTFPCSDGLCDRYRIRKPFLLYVSTIQPYKHQIEILDGFHRYCMAEPRTENLQLVLAGPNHGQYASRVKVAAGKLKERVVCTGAVPREDIPRLLAQADILLFGSTCETCPNLLLEYLAAGRPIVCSNSDPMPEFGGDAVRYVDATDPQAWCDSIHDLQSNQLMKQKRGVRARQRSELFSWDESARKTLAALTDWP